MVDRNRGEDIRGDDEAGGLKPFIARYRGAWAFPAESKACQSLVHAEASPGHSDIARTGTVRPAAMEGG